MKRGQKNLEWEGVIGSLTSHIIEISSDSLKVTLLLSCSSIQSALGFFDQCTYPASKPSKHGVLIFRRPKLFHLNQRLEIVFIIIIKVPRSLPSCAMGFNLGRKKSTNQSKEERMTAEKKRKKNVKEQGNCT